MNPSIVNPSRVLKEALHDQVNDLARMMNISLDWVSELIYERGVEYAEGYYRAAKVATKAIQDPAYWHWFLIQWRRCDRNMMATLDLDSLSQPGWAAMWYDMFHDITELSAIKQGAEAPEQPVKPWSEIAIRAMKNH